MISGTPKLAEISNAVKRMNENHLANQLRYSLRVSVTWLTFFFFYILIKDAELAFCRCMLLSYTCSCPSTSRSCFGDKKSNATASRLISYIANALVIHPNSSCEQRRFVFNTTLFCQVSPTLLVHSL
jgi:hypothetical protein